MNFIEIVKLFFFNDVLVSCGKDLGIYSEYEFDEFEIRKVIFDIKY